MTPAECSVDPHEAEEALRLALSRGGEWAELFWERQQTVRLAFDDGHVEDATGGVEQGVGIRVVWNDRTTFADGNVAGVADLMAVARRAAGGVGEATGVHAVADLTPDRIAPHSVVGIDPRDVAVGDKLDLLRRADAAARRLDARVEQVTARYDEGVQEVIVANSEGLFRRDTRVRLDFNVRVVAKAGESVESADDWISGTQGFERFAGDAVERAARAAARRAVLTLDVDPLPAGTYMVVLSSDAGGTLVHESVGHGLEADVNFNGLSVYAHRIGEKVASELVTVVDDGTAPGMRGTTAIDDEGTPTQRTVLIENGVLRTYLTDRRCAEKLGLPPTGNARRESFRFMPLCRMTNLIVLPGAWDPDAIVRSVGDGLFVARIGGGQVDVVSGNVAFSVKECYRIREGRVAEPVRGATLAGYGPGLMSEIDMIGSNLGCSTGTCGKRGQGAPVAHAQPTLRLRSVLVGGAG